MTTCAISIFATIKIVPYLADSFDFFKLYSSFEKSGNLLSAAVLVLPAYLYLKCLKTKDHETVAETNMIAIGIISFITLASTNIHIARIAYYPLMITPLLAAKVLTQSRKDIILLMGYSLTCLIARMYTATQAEFDYINNFNLTL